jgi:hypothetical protein
MDLFFTVEDRFWSGPSAAANLYVYRTTPGELRVIEERDLRAFIRDGRSLSCAGWVEVARVKLVYRETEDGATVSIPRILCMKFPTRAGGRFNRQVILRHPWEYRLAKCRWTLLDNERAAIESGVNDLIERSVAVDMLELLSTFDLV